jgi:hypothetical protein
MLFVAFGLIIYLGDSRLLAGFNVMTEQERSHYNMDKITSFTGVNCVLMSYTFFLLFVSIILFSIAFAAVTAAMIIPFYTRIGKRFDLTSK